MSNHLKNTFKGVHYLVKFQAIGLQRYNKWTSSQVFYKDCDHEHIWQFYKTPPFKKSYFERTSLLATCETSIIGSYITAKWRNNFSNAN